MPVATVIGSHYGGRKEYAKGDVIEVTQAELDAFPDKLREETHKQVDTVSIANMNATDVIAAMDSGAMGAAYVLQEERMGKNRKTVINAAKELLGDED